MSYNGWSNRETWLVNVWFNPENKQDLDSAQETIEQQYDAIPDGPLKDMIDISAINWDELETHFDDEENEEEEE